MMRILPIVPLLLLLLPETRGQQRQVTRRQQYWAGYITTAALSEKYSMVNEIHLVPHAFASLRSGIMRQYEGWSISAGHGYLWLTAGGESDELTRHEHRPWFQYQSNLPIGKHTTSTQRIRYEARFREKLEAGEVVDGYIFNHRVRFMMSVKRNLGRERKAGRPLLVLSNEIFLNFGNQVANTFDQNRIAVMAGFQREKLQYQLGWMNRLVQTGDESYNLNSTIVLWVTHRFDLRRVLHPAEIHDTGN